MNQITAKHMQFNTLVSTFVYLRRLQSRESAGDAPEAVW